MKRSVGLLVLGLSAAGYPLTQIVIRRWGTPAAFVVEGVSLGLAVRDASMIAGGAPNRLRPFPGALLRLELAAAVAASIGGLYPLLCRPKHGRRSSARSRGIEMARRVALVALFGLHTIRFGIYLQPDQGRRKAA